MNVSILYYVWLLILVYLKTLATSMTSRFKVIATLLQILLQGSLSATILAQVAIHNGRARCSSGQFFIYFVGRHLFYIYIQYSVILAYLVELFFLYVSKVFKGLKRLRPAHRSFTRQSGLDNRISFGFICYLAKDCPQLWIYYAVTTTTADRFDHKSFHCLPKNGWK